MAIAFVSNGAVTTQGSGSTSITPALPATVTAGNLLVSWVLLSQASGTRTISVSSGWNLTFTNTDGTNLTSAAVAWRIADGSTDTAPTFSWTTGAPTLAQVHQYSGTDTSSPIANSSYNNGNGTTVTITPITTTFNGNVVFVVEADTSSGNIPPTATGYTSRSTQNIASPATWSMRSEDQTFATAGTSSGSASATITSRKWVAIAFEIGIAGSAVTSLTETKYTNTNTFGSDTLSFGFTTTKFTNTNTFGTDSIAQLLTTTKYTNTNTFGTDQVNYTLVETKYTNTNTFGTDVFRIDQTWTATKYTNTNTFGSHTFIKEQFLTGTILTNSNSFGTDTFTVFSSSDQNLTEQLLSNINRFGHSTIFIAPAPSAYGRNIVQRRREGRRTVDIQTLSTNGNSIFRFY